MSSAAIWLIATLAIAGMLFRPWRWPEWIWAWAGAVAVVAAGLLPARAAAEAVARGTDVYLFLAGMMLMSELARREGVFEWLASRAATSARGSKARLFALIYVAGTTVTVLLSNDATAVVLTPAVYAATRRARVDPVPYLIVCALIANAASFVLPISNPANLVVFGSSLPRLGPWLRMFVLPSVVAIAITFLVLRALFRKQLRGSFEVEPERAKLTLRGRRSAWSIAAFGAILLGSSAFGIALGLPAVVSALALVGFVTAFAVRAVREIFSGVAWSVLALVAGLFVLVEAMQQAGALELLSRGLRACASVPPFAGSLAVAAGATVLSNAMNNLSTGLLAAGLLRTTPASETIRAAVLIGVDLGPNLSVTGSLATLLWLLALRREGVEMTPLRFLRIGALALPPALIAAVAVAALTTQ